MSDISKEYYPISEDEMQALIVRSQAGDKRATQELLNLFEPYINKYVSLLYYGKYDLKFYDIRRFIHLFVPDKKVGYYLLRNKINESGREQVLDVINGLRYMTQRYCLAGETEVITSEGTYQIRDLAGKNVKVLTRAGRSNGSWVYANFKSYGVQPLSKITLKRNKTTKIIYATPEHSWFTQKIHGYSKVTTNALKAGDKLCSVYGNSPTNKSHKSSFGIAAGFVFGDGTKPKASNQSALACFYGEKDKEILQWFPPCNRREVAGGFELSGIPRSWKDEVNLEEGISFLYGWLAGYLAADGSIDSKGSACIHSAEKWRLEKARDVCYKLGIKTLGITCFHRNSPYSGEYSPLYKLSFPVGALPKDFFLLENHRNNYKDRDKSTPDWKIISVEPSNRVEEVYCAEVPDTHSFALADNILTGNCSELDVRQTVEMTFLMTLKRYEPTEKDGKLIPFSAYIYSYFYYLLSKHVKIYMIDQLGRKTFPLVADEDNGGEDDSVTPGFKVPLEKSAEEVFADMEIDEYWVLGDTALWPFDMLGVHERQLLKWRYVDRMKYNQIAAKIAEHPNTCREHIARIRTKVKSLVAQDEE